MLLLDGEGRAVFFDGDFYGFTTFASAFLDTTDQFFLLAFDELEIVIRERGPFLFEVALDDVPVAFDFECCHRPYLCTHGHSLTMG